jgi:zinc finger FYVE domain-containing protein 26
VEQLCDQLCYRLELAYFAARSIKGVEGQSVSTRIFVKGSRPKADNIEGPADPFVANLVLERLTLHSPVRVGLYVLFLDSTWFAFGWRLTELIASVVL